jgi:transposase-like protein
VCDTRLMSTPLTHRDKNHHFQAGIINHDVWLYFRFYLSYRDVEELLFDSAVSGTGSCLSFMTKTRFHMTRAAC